MKNYFIAFSMAITALLLAVTSCQKFENGSPADGKETIVTVNVGVPGVATKATGDGTSVNRCIMEIYEGGVLYGERHYATIENLSASFQLRLISGRTYNFVFWADVADVDEFGVFSDLYYNTANGLGAVTQLATTEYANSVEAYDAFTASGEHVVTAATELNFTLKRPFGQVNLFTTDLYEIPATVDLSKVRARVTFDKVPTTFNAIEQTLGAEVGKVEPTTFVVPIDFPKTADEENLAEVAQITFDYLFGSPAEDQTMVDFVLELDDTEGNEVAADFSTTNIPVRANYQTNVYANFLTKAVDVKIEINPEFDTPANEETIGDDGNVISPDQPGEGGGEGGEVVDPNPDQPGEGEGGGEVVDPNPDQPGEGGGEVVDPDPDPVATTVYSWTLASGELGSATVVNTTVSAGEPALEWTLSYTPVTEGDAPYMGYLADRGAQIGSSGRPMKEFVMSTTATGITVAEIVINAAIASNGTATLSVSVGGVAVLENQALTTTATEYSITLTEPVTSGDVVIRLDNTQRAAYIKEIRFVEYR